jgi:hypothetical protein
MLWSDQWRRLARRFERFPLWVQVTIFPLFAPAVFTLAAVCLCPRTAASSSLVLVVAYGLLLRHGLIGWEEVGGTLGRMYLLFVATTYLGMLQHLSERAFDWITGRRSALSDQESQAPSPPGNQ